MTDTRVDRPQRPAPSGSPDLRDYAACRDTDPELFFPIGNAGPALLQLDRARQVCAGCPVHTSCLEWALASGARSRTQAVEQARALGLLAPSSRRR